MQKQENNQLYGVEGRFARKTDVEEYVRRVKEKNPNGVVVCIDTEEGTHEKIKTDGAFNVAHLLNIGYEPEEIRGKIPKTYTPMSLTIKDMLINEVIVPLYFQKNKLKAAGLNSFGVQGMIINKELFPIEVNREARFSKKGFYDKKDETER